MYKFLVVVWLLLLGYGSVAQISDEDYYLIKDLRQEWLAIDQANRYVPFVARNQSNPSVIGIHLNLAQYQGNQLRCCVPANTSVLLNKQILASVKRHRCLTYDIDSLQQVYQAETLLLTVYQPDRALNQVEVQIVNDSVRPLGQEHAAVQRMTSARQNFFVIGLVAILILYALLINHYAKTFKNVYSLSKILAFRAREEDIRVRLVSEPHIFFLIQHCLLIAFLLVLLVPDNGFFVFSTPISLNGLGGHILLWLAISVLILAVVVVKYLVIVTFGSLFKLRHLIHLHMFDFMRLSLMFWGIIFLLAVCAYHNLHVSEYLYGRILTYLFVGFALVRILILYLRLFRNASFKNMYLFSYICTAEIIPLFVGLELLIDW